MKIGVLTSSRADYGIYLPLLNKLKSDTFFDLEIIAFGTHLSKFHGFTIENILKDSYPKVHRISTILSNDDAVSIATSYGLTALKFSDFWNSNTYDLVLCLGDRFEMSAAVQAGIPFGVKFAHIHGGETTLGAIDNIYRHQITIASILHFTSTEEYQNKIRALTGSDQNNFIVGALSLDEIHDFQPLNRNEFFQKFNLNDQPYALVTFHPETVSASRNSKFAEEMKQGLSQVLEELNLVITMPNADTVGTIYREAIIELKDEYPDKVTLIENFGKINYFTAIHYAKLIIGNSSSGIIEAASFKTYVINVGDRQKGRLQSENVFNVEFNAEEIIKKTKYILSLGDYKGENIYFREGASSHILNTIKTIHEKL